MLFTKLAHCLVDVVPLESRGMLKKLTLYSFGQIHDVLISFFTYPFRSLYLVDILTCVELLSLFSFVKFLSLHGWNVQLIKLWLFAARSCRREGFHARIPRTWKFKSERRGPSPQKCRVFANTILWTQFLEDPHQSCIGRAGSDP